MAISALEPASTASSASKLTLEDFMKVLLTQLTYQDPLKPMDNQQFMSQVAQLTTLEQTQGLNTKLEALLNNQSALQSVGLLGRTVDVNADSGAVTGKVSALSLAGPFPSLTVLLENGASMANVSLGQVTAVR